MRDDVLSFVVLKVLSEYLVYHSPDANEFPYAISARVAKIKKGSVRSKQVAGRCTGRMMQFSIC